MNEGLNREVASAKKYGENWEERAGSMYESLVEKLETFKTLYGILENLLNGKIEKEETLKQIDDFKNKTEAETSPDILDKCNEMMKIWHKTEALSAEIIKSLDQRIEEFGFDEDPEIEEKVTLRDELFEKILKTKDSDPKLDFLFLIEKALVYFKEALNKIEGYKKNSELILKDLAEARGIDYETLKSDLKIKKIIFGPFSVNLVLEENADLMKDDDGEYYAGLHTRDSLIHVISNNSDEEEIEASIRHEDEHMIMNAFPEFFMGIGPPSSTFKEVLYSGKENGFLNKRANEAKKGIFENKTGRYSPTYLLDSSQYEILAALAESPKLIDYLKSTQKITMPATLSTKQGVETIKLLSTAGSQILEITSLLKEGEKSKYPDYAKKCSEIRFHYVNMFLRSMGNLGYSYLLAEKFGNEAKKDVYLLSYLLRPSQYHRIPVFIETKYN